MSADISQDDSTGSLEFDQADSMNPFTIFAFIGSLIGGALASPGWFIIAAILIPVLAYRNVWRIDLEARHISSQLRLGPISLAEEVFPFDEIKKVIFHPFKPLGTIYMKGAPNGYELLIRRSTGDRTLYLAPAQDSLRLDTIETIYKELRKVLPRGVDFYKSKSRRAT